MKFLLVLATFSTLLFSTGLRARSNFDQSMPKSIYGRDDRRSVMSLSKITEVREIKLARAVLAQVPKWRVKEENQATFSVFTQSLSSGLNFCADEKFSSMPMVSSCSAFLVGTDLMLTAGHCVKDMHDCKESYWILDFDNPSGFLSREGVTRFKRENVVKCAEILSRSERAGLDYALIKLNRKITDRAPLKLRRFSNVSRDASLIVIGHPLGLPKIIAQNVMVLDNSFSNVFLTNADTFSGNSGSPVINPINQLVEGILVKGEQDFQMDLDLGCNRAYKCVKGECLGESVQRSRSLPLSLIPKI